VAIISMKKAATDANAPRVYRLIAELTIWPARIAAADQRPIRGCERYSGRQRREHAERLISSARSCRHRSVEAKSMTVTFEGYGAAEWDSDQCVTTNRNRAVGEMSTVMGKITATCEVGAVGWMFHRKGEISCRKKAATETVWNLDSWKLAAKT